MDGAVKRSPIQPGNGPTRKTPMKRRNARRKASELLRAYGPPQRRAWLVLRPCVACGRVGTEEYPNHQHHTENGGKGRKADADTTVSLCPPCHQLHHDGNGPDLDWQALARETEEAWQNVGR